MLQFMRHNGILTIRVYAILDIFPTRHQFVTHGIQAQVPQFSLLYQSAMFPLTFPRCSPDPITSMSFFRRHILSNVRRRCSGNACLLLNIRLGRSTAQPGLSVAFPFATLPFRCFLSLLPLASGFIFAHSFARGGCSGWQICRMKVRCGIHLRVLQMYSFQRRYCCDLCASGAVKIIE